MTQENGPTFDYMGERVTCCQLLERYNPILVLHPRDPTLKRPGSLLAGKGRGDYHPCTAEFFISKLAWYEERRGFFRRASKEQPEEPGFIKTKAAEGATEGWEIDIAAYSSGDVDAAWQSYGRWLAEEEEARKCVAYARCVLQDGLIVLQYWYLYIYNDAGNTHEGDWEMVSIEVDPKEGPRQVGYAGHGGGARRLWADASKDGNHPRVFVARGSHASYLNHMPKGHKSLHLELEKGLPSPFRQIVDVLQRAAVRTLYFWGVRDHTPSPENGVLVTPEVRLMPDNASVDDEKWWWMNLDCRWGSSHARISDFTGPLPPWKKHVKWLTPLAWISEQDPH